MNKQILRFFRITSPTVKVFLLGSLMTVSLAQAGVSCHLVNAKGVGQDLGGGSITGNVIGGGLLQGTITRSISPHWHLWHCSHICGNGDVHEPARNLDRRGHGGD